MIKTGKTMAVELAEYNGNYSITQGNEDKEGNFRPEWVRKSKWDRETRGPVLDEKNTPLKVYLGSKERAIEVLEALLWELKGGPGEAINQGDDSDIPF